MPNDITSSNSAQENPRTDGPIGASVLLSAVATCLTLVAFWIINATNERYRGRTDLDMPDWFVINMDLTLQVFPLGGLATMLNIIAAGVAIGWFGRASWPTRAGFVLQLLGSLALGAVLVWSRMPHSQ